jgi:Zn-dependent M28 family amino/carboxypeptidase
MEIDATNEERITSNVVAEAEWGEEGRVVMLGGHLDSVPAGPGINDNGSGTATLLEIAEELAELDVPTRSRIRFAFWGAEEFGLLGSIHYVESLGEEEVRALDAYLNFDMLGSSNYARFVYNGRQTGSSDSEGSLQIQQIFEDHFEGEGLPTKLVPLEDRSDHAIFAANGIAVGGLFSGADELKTPEEVRVYGGLPRELHDPCYHLPCDTIDRVNFEILDQMADAAVDALAALAARGR